MSSETSTLASHICSHIASIFSKPTNAPPLETMACHIALAGQKGRIFLYGVGREGLMLQGLGMRLAHLGLSAHFVSDITTPISSKDLLIASAGPAGFSTVDEICSMAKSAGAEVLLLSCQPNTESYAERGIFTCYVPAQTVADDEGRPLMPIGSVYEGALFVLFEMVVYKLGPGSGSES